MPCSQLHPSSTNPNHAMIRHDSSWFTVSRIPLIWTHRRERFTPLGWQKACEDSLGVHYFGCWDPILVGLGYVGDVSGTVGN